MEWALIRFRSSDSYARNSDAYYDIKRLTGSTGVSKEQAEVFQQRYDNDLTAQVVLAKFLVYLATRFNSAEAQIRLRERLKKLYLDYTGVNAENVLNMIESSLNLCGNQTEEQMKERTRETFQEALKHNLMQAADNTTLRDNYRGLIFNINQEIRRQKDAGKDEYQALRKTVEDLSRSDENALLKNEMAQADTLGRNITGVMETPPQGSNDRKGGFHRRIPSSGISPSIKTSHKLIDAAKANTGAYFTSLGSSLDNTVDHYTVLPNYHTPIDHNQSISHINESATPTLPPAVMDLWQNDSGQRLSCLPSITQEPRTGAFILSIYHNIREAHPDFVLPDSEVQSPSNEPMTTEEGNKRWYYVVNKDIDPPIGPHADTECVSLVNAVTTSVSLLQKLAMDPITGACPCCGFCWVHDGLGCPYLCKLTLDREKRITMNVFRLAYQDEETRKIWIKQAQEMGCLKDLTPNELSDFKGLVQKQAAANYQKRQELRRARDMGEDRPRPPFQARLNFEGRTSDARNY